MPTKLVQRVHTDAIADALTDGDLSVGLGVRNTQPDGKGTLLPPPCVVVHPISGGARFGTLDDWTAHATLVYQLTCVGQTQEQAEWVRDECELLLDGLTVSGRHVELVRQDFGSDGVERGDRTGDLVFTCMTRYRLTSSPA